MGRRKYYWWGHTRPQSTQIMRFTSRRIQKGTMSVQGILYKKGVYFSIFISSSRRFSARPFQAALAWDSAGLPSSRYQTDMGSRCAPRTSLR